MACTITYNGEQYSQEDFLKLLESGKVQLSKPSKTETKVKPEEKITDSAKAIKDKVKNIVNGTTFVLQYFGNDYDSIASRKPTEEELNEFETLQKKGELKSSRYKELQLKLNEWKILDGTRDSDQDSSLADYVTMINNLNTPIEVDNTQTEYSESDYEAINQADESTEKGGYDKHSAVKTPDTVLASTYNGGLEFSFISPAKFAEFFPEHTLVTLEDGIEKPFTENKTKGSKYLLKGATDIEFKIGDNSRIQIDEKTFAQNAKDVIIKSGGVNGFRNVFTLKDGVYSPLESDYAFPHKTKKIEVNRTAVNSTQNGTEVRLVVDKNDLFNSRLFAQYKKGTITKEELINQVSIYIYNGSNLVGNFSAITETAKVSDGLDRNRSIRDTAIEEALFSDAVEVTVPVKGISVDMVLLGNPNVVLDENQNTIENPFTLDSIQNVVGQGIASQDKQGNYPKDTLFVYVDVAVKKNQGKQVPFVVVRYADKNIAYPISLTKQTIDHSKSLTDILNSNLSVADKANKVIDLMRATKTKVEIDFTNSDWTRSQAIKDLLNKLEAVQSTILNVEDLTKNNFDKQNLVTSAKIAIDIVNYPFSAGKILLTLPNITTPLAENRRVDIVDNLYTLAKDFYNDLKDNRQNYEDKDGNVDEESVFYQAMDKIGDILDSKVNENYAFKKGIVDALRQAVSTTNKKAKNSIGEEKWNKAKDLLKQLEKTTAIETQNKELKKQTEDKDCK